MLITDMLVCAKHSRESQIRTAHVLRLESLHFILGGLDPSLLLEDASQLLRIDRAAVISVILLEGRFEGLALIAGQPGGQRDQLLVVGVLLPTSTTVTSTQLRVVNNLQSRHG
jgi:hypothetical protein